MTRSTRAGSMPARWIGLCLVLALGICLVTMGGRAESATVEQPFTIYSSLPFQGDSVLGTYDIDDHGDTTLPDYGGFRVEDGELVFDRGIKTAP